MSKSRPTLTPAEIEIVRKSHAMGALPGFVARQLNCSVRAITKRYAVLNGRPPSPRKRHVTAPISKPASDKPPRAPARPNLYTSNFEPT